MDEYVASAPVIEYVAFAPVLSDFLEPLVFVFQVLQFFEKKIVAIPEPLSGQNTQPSESLGTEPVRLVTIAEIVEMEGNEGCGTTARLNLVILIRHKATVLFLDISTLACNSLQMSVVDSAGLLTDETGTLLGNGNVWYRQ